MLSSSCVNCWMSWLDAGMLSVGVTGGMKPSWAFSRWLCWPGSGGGGMGGPATTSGIGRDTGALSEDRAGESSGFSTGSCELCVTIAGGGSAAAVETSRPDWERSAWRTLAY